MNRRTFLNWAGIGLVASYFPIALAACQSSSDNSTSATPTAAATEDFISLGTEVELQTNGYLLNEASKVMVVRDGGKIVALNPTCTHRGCIVEWNSEANTLVCPCHDAKFAPDGEVLAQPAVEPLSTYQVRQDNGEILVKLA